ncbi:hypothetical protein PG985_003327 [Apiospora marii]|uniref:uncharacterized protein n=1 Tax=Apiospora marii TaxID=335849 RepID=UPI0031305CA0
MPHTNDEPAETIRLALHNLVTQAEYEAFFNILGDMVVTDPRKRHLAMNGCWSHEYAAWHVDAFIWRSAYSNSGLTQGEQMEAFCTLFPAPELSDDPWDTWLPSLLKILEEQREYGVARETASDTTDREKQEKERIGMMEENHNLPTDTDSQAGEGGVVLNAQKATILRVSKWISTVKIINQEELKYADVAGYLLTTLLHGNSWTLLEGVIANGEPESWYCLGALKSRKLVDTQDGYQCQCGMARCIQLSAQETSTRALHFRAMSTS